MKAIKIRPSQRQLLVVFSMTILTGCSGLQPKSVYKSLEQRVQHVYKAAAPIHKEGLVPALFRTVSMPGRNALALNRPEILKAGRLIKAPPTENRKSIVTQNKKHLEFLKLDEHAKQKQPVETDRSNPVKGIRNKKRSMPIKNLQYIEKYYGL